MIDRGSTMMLDFNSKVGCVQTSKLDMMLNKNSNEFQTDSSIKKTDFAHLQGRNLESVDNSWLDPSMDTALEGGKEKYEKEREWDQFATNKSKFGVNSTYDENFYTKKLDMSKMSKEQIAHAARLAKEIESTTSSNIHLQEERGQLQQQDIDEETMYSGVVRDDKEMSNFNNAANNNSNGKKGASSASSASTLSS